VIFTHSIRTEVPTTAGTIFTEKALAHDISVILTGQVGITEGITAAVDIMVAVVMAVVVMAVVVMAVVVMVVGVVMAAGFTSNGDTTRSTARL